MHWIYAKDELPVVIANDDGINSSSQIICGTAEQVFIGDYIVWTDDAFEACLAWMPCLSQLV